MVLIAMMVCVAAGGAFADPALIDFEDISTTGPGAVGPTAVFGQYLSKGVLLNRPVALDYSKGDFAIPGFAHSGSVVIQQCYSQEFCNTPIRFSFTTGQRHVRVWVGYRFALSESRTVVLVAKNAGGSEVARASAPLGPGSGPHPVNILLEVTSPSPDIKEASVGFDPVTITNGLAVDDLEFDAIGPPVCPSSFSPHVTLTKPTLGSKVQLNEFILQGEVVTDGVLDSVELFITGTGSSEIDLLAAGVVSPLGGAFGPVRVDGALFKGSNGLTLVARNCRGSGSTTTSITFAEIAKGTKFVVTGLEITQAIQTLANSVPLIADKRTVARLYLRVDGPTTSIANVSADLTGHRPGTPPMLPQEVGPPLPPANLRSTNSITVDSSTDITGDRRDITASLNFDLPPGWISEGQLYLQVARIYIDGVPSTLPCVGCENVNVFGFPKFVRFEESAPVRLKTWTVPYVMKVGGVDTTFLPSALDLDFFESWIARAYPTSSVISTRGTTKGFIGVPDQDFDAGDVNSRLFWTWFSDILGGTTDPRTKYYGITSDVGQFMRGLADGIPGTVASGPAGVPGGPNSAGSSGGGWDTDACTGAVTGLCATYGDYYGGHEVAHLYGRKHPGFCGGNSKDDDDYPYPGGFIGGGALREFGFDLGDAGRGIPRRIYPPDVWTDVMTYCSNEWISDYTYLGILDNLRDLESASAVLTADSPLIISSGGLLVQGRIDLASDAVELKPFVRLDTAIFTGRPDISPYTIDLLGAGPTPLASYPFEPKRDSERLPGDEHAALISEVVPYVAGTTRIVISKNGIELASRSVSPNAPTVFLVTPNGGQTLQGDLETEFWQAFDPDSDPLRFVLQYSRDAGTTWMTVDTDIEDLSYDVDLRNLPGGSQALFRIIATDGVNTTSDVSDAPFTVPMKDPKARIISPESGSVFAAAQTPVFVGEAMDLEDGALGGNALRWTSDVDGVLGFGPSVAAANLTPGIHVITFSATDSSGAEGQDSIVIFIERGLPVANAGPDLVVFAGRNAYLSAAGSTGFGTLKYHWDLISKPRTSQARIVNADSAQAWLKTDMTGFYTVQLTVIDQTGAAAVDRAVIRGFSFIL